LLTAAGLLQSLISGVLLGFLYAVMAYGLTLTFGVMRVINNSHTVSMLLGSYISYWLFILYGIDPHISVILSFTTLFIIGLILEKVMIEPLLKLPDKQFEMSTLIITFGGFMILEGMITGLWSGDFRAISTYYSGMSVTLDSVVVPITRIASFVIATVMSIALTVILMKTKIGKAIRATAQDKDAAMCMGIDPKKIYLLAFAIGTASAGVAGTAFAIAYPFFPAIHREWLGKVFTIVVLGGMGSVLGAFIGGLILGVLESIASYILPASITPIVAYIVLLIVLYIKPTGIFGVK